MEISQHNRDDPDYAKHRTEMILDCIRDMLLSDEFYVFTVKYGNPAEVKIKSLTRNQGIPEWIDVLTKEVRELRESLLAR